MTPWEIADSVALPVILRTNSYKEEVEHFIYVRPYQPKIPDEDALRSLFLINVPICTTLQHIRHLFGSQLSAGRVERVEFSEISSRKHARPSRKRKRVTTEELEADLDKYSLPQTIPGDIHASGSSATVVFVDRASKEQSLKAVRKAAKQKTLTIWGDGIAETNMPPQGLKRYESLQYPAREGLLRLVDNYMTAYGSLEEARSRENARKRAEPDEDGFVMVTRGSKGVVKQDDAKVLGQQMKAREEKRALVDFYRFQTREKRKQQSGEAYRRFQEDKRRVEEMRARNGDQGPG